VKSLSRAIRERRSPLEIAIAFTIQESNAHEVGRICAWMREVGAHTLHLKQLNVVSNAEDWERSFLKYRMHDARPDGGRMERLEEAIRAAIAECEAGGIHVSMLSELPMTGALEGRHCIAAPLISAYFSYDGKVAPCCHFGHHVSRYFDGTYYEPSALFFGDIRRQDLPEIWDSPPFRAFREAFAERTFPEACRTCYLLYGK